MGVEGIVPVGGEKVQNPPRQGSAGRRPPLCVVCVRRNATLCACRRRGAGSTHMNREMMEVLPTAWSPMKTSLYLRRPFCAPAAAAIMSERGLLL